MSSSMWRVVRIESIIGRLDRHVKISMREVGSTHRISGTCKRGPASDPTAVVDPYGRVRGLAGIRVADASIMPDCVRANTNATTMMIGERMADLIMRGA